MVTIDQYCGLLAHSTEVLRLADAVPWVSEEAQGALNSERAQLLRPLVWSAGRHLRPVPRFQHLDIEPIRAFALQKFDRHGSRVPADDIRVMELSVESNVAYRLALRVTMSAELVGGVDDSYTRETRKEQGVDTIGYPSVSLASICSVRFVALSCLRLAPRPSASTVVCWHEPYLNI